ncbi:HAD-IA family hydrolase [Ferruginivarius sediminum]|uniref:Haloacid dehalogenase n=1 Tax=Ferruginivarius sediminum TaxID=2661937 RepID=A0A369T8X2_9PROT|nr:HAD-IA family hydrolase [Ferruginivarius sediminum]RDD61753.1 haloacid dehalogenase [Ferruginivarius sediminum]
MRLSEFDALTFDVYGTLIDWETGIAEALTPWAESAGLAVTRADLVAAFGRFESKRQQENPETRYPEVLELVFEDIARSFGVEPRPADAAEFGESVGNWPAFPDSAEALAYLARHYRLGVISNVDRASFVASNRKLGVDFDIIVTAEDAGAYKPNLKPFHMALERLSEIGVGFDRLLHTAQSLFHDHAPGKELGLTTCWIDRQGQAGGNGDWGATPPPPGAPKPDIVFPSMAALVEAHKKEMAG